MSGAMTTTGGGLDTETEIIEARLAAILGEVRACLATGRTTYKQVERVRKDVERLRKDVAEMESNRLAYNPTEPDEETEDDDES